jgi:hypothetical protein
MHEMFDLLKLHVVFDLLWLHFQQGLPCLALLK